MDWLTAAEALRLLQTQPQSLYANVSRGRIQARPDPNDSRRSLYRGEDVRRLASRAGGRRKTEAVATDAMHWGDPVLRTAISTVRNGRLIYRGHDAAQLSRTAGLEETAKVLWLAPVAIHTVPDAGQGLAATFAALAANAAEAGSAPRSTSALLQQAGAVLSTFVQTLACGMTEDAVHVRLAKRWDCDDAADVLRRALVLLADHELNSSSFAARVTVSTGASLWAGALAALGALSGPRHGLGSIEVAALAEDVGHDPHPDVALREWLGEGRHLPGMGHPLYRSGDIRSETLLESFAMPPEFAAYLGAAHSLSGEEPNIDFALAALTRRFRLPPDAAMTLFALGRSVGWLAHMMEQVASGEQIRPRARYVGQ